MPCPSAQAQHRRSSSSLGIQAGCTAPPEADAGLGGSWTAVLAQLMKNCPSEPLPGQPKPQPVPRQHGRIFKCQSSRVHNRLPLSRPARAAAPRSSPLLTELIDRAMLAETSRVAAPDD